jgi:hypothetical protein
LTKHQVNDMINVLNNSRERIEGAGSTVTFLVNTHRNRIGRSTGRIRLVTTLYLVLLAKVVLLLAGGAAVPGGPDRHSMQPTIGTSRSGIPIDAGHNAMTPLGAVWSRIIAWLRNRTATPQGYDPQDLQLHKATTRRTTTRRTTTRRPRPPRSYRPTLRRTHRVEPVRKAQHACQRHDQ